MKRVFGALSVILVFSFLSACSKFGSGNKYGFNEVNVEEQSVSSDTSSVSETNVSSQENTGVVEDNIIAVIGNKKVYKHDFEVWKEITQQTLAGGNKQEKEVLFQSFLQTAILAEIARQRGIDKEAEVRKKIETQVDSILAGELLSREIPSFSEEEIGQMYNDFFSALDSAEDVNSFPYDKYRFVKYASIYLPYISNLTVEPQERDVYVIAVDSKETAKKVLADFWANGGDAQAFRMLARNYSILDSARRGGKEHYSSSEIQKQILLAKSNKDLRKSQDLTKLSGIVFSSLKKDAPSQIFYLFGKYYIFFSNKDVKGGRKHRMWEDLSQQERAAIIALFQRAAGIAVANDLISDYKKREKVVVYPNKI